jgi:hypothetical protein
MIERVILSYKFLRLKYVHASIKIAFVLLYNLYSCFKKKIMTHLSIQGGHLFHEEFARRLVNHQELST